MRRAIERNEISEYFHQSTEWLKAHLENVIIGAVVAIVAVFIARFYFSNRAERLVKASMLAADAARVYEQALSRGVAKDGKDSLNQAQSKYKEVVDGYPGSPAEPEAVLGLANCDFAAEKYAQAQAAFTAFLTKYPQHPLAPLALASQGYCLEALGKNLDAGESFAAVAARYPQAANKALSQLDAARNYQAAGEKEKAKAVLESLAKDKDQPETLVAKAKAKLAAL
jgi:tetratricopeptide (TPR) repeat protein